MDKMAFLGEILLRITLNQPLSDRNSGEISFGGSEFNIAQTLSAYGNDVTFISKINQNDFSAQIEKIMHMNKVDYSLSYCEKRLGTYYLMEGFGLRQSKVIYDREDTAFRTITLNEITGGLKGIDHLHISGVTSAVLEAKLIFDIVDYCRKMQISISYDSNYRAALWSQDEAGKMLDYICQNCQLLFAGPKDFELLLKIKLDNKSLNRNLELCQKVKDKYPNIENIAFTERDIYTVEKHALKAYYYDGKDLYSTQKIKFPVLDRVGAGDNFTASILHGLSQKLNPQSIIDFALKSTIYKHTINGDYIAVSKTEIDNFELNEIGNIKR